MPSRQHVEIQRLRWTGRAAGLGWPGDALLRQYILPYFKPFLSLLSPREGQVPGWDLPRSPRRSRWAPHPAGHLLPGRGCLEDMLTQQAEDCARQKGQSITLRGHHQALPPAMQCC